MDTKFETGVKWSKTQKKNADGVKEKQGWTSPDSESDPSWRSVTSGLKIPPQGVKNMLTGVINSMLDKTSRAVAAHLRNAINDHTTLTCYFFCSFQQQT